MVRHGGRGRDRGKEKSAAFFLCLFPGALPASGYGRGPVEADRRRKQGPVFLIIPRPASSFSKPERARTRQGASGLRMVSSNCPARKDCRAAMLALRGLALAWSWPASARLIYLETAYRDAGEQTGLPAACRICGIQKPRLPPLSQRKQNQNAFGMDTSQDHSGHRSNI